MPIINLDKNILALMGMLTDIQQQEVRDTVFDRLFISDEIESENPYANVLIESLKAALSAGCITDVKPEIQPPAVEPKRDSSLLYQSHIQSLRSLPDAEFGRCMKQIYDYAFYGIEPDRGQMTQAFALIWGIMKASMDTAHKKYDACVANGKKGAEHGKKGAEYGKLGGRPRKKQEGDASEANTDKDVKTPQSNPTDKPANQSPLSVSDSVSVSVSSFPLKENEDEKIKNKKNSGSVSLEETDPNEEKKENGVRELNVPTMEAVADFFRSIGKSEQSAERFYRYNAERKWQALVNKGWTTLADEWRDFDTAKSEAAPETRPSSSGGPMSYEEFVAALPEDFRRNPQMLHMYQGGFRAPMSYWYESYKQSWNDERNGFFAVLREEYARRKVAEEMEAEEERKRRLEYEKEPEF